MLSRLNRSRLTKNVGKLILGSGLGQLVSFLATPLISRLYAPESVGEQTALLSLVAPIGALASLAFPIAIVLAREDREALALGHLAFWGSLIISSLATLILLINDMWLLRWMGLQEVGSYGLLIPILVVFVTMNQSATYLMTRYEAFGLSAKAAAASAVVSNMFKLAFGVASASTLSLIAGNALGYLVGPLMAYRLRGEKSSKVHRFSVAELKATAYRHRDFALLRAPQNVLSAFSQALPVIGLTVGFGSAAAGYYAMAMALTGAPITLIGNSVQSVLYPRLTAAAQTGENSSRLLLLSTLGLVVLGAPFFLLIAAVGEPLFRVLLGPGWGEAGVYSQLLVPLLWLGLANRPVVALVPALGLQHGLLIYEFIGIPIKAAAIAFGIFSLHDARLVVGIYALIGALAYLLLIIWVFLRSRKSYEDQKHGKTG